MTAAFSSLTIAATTALVCCHLSYAAAGHRIKERANAVQTLMSYMVIPDITASDINIGTGTNESNELNITQLGGAQR